MTCTFCANARSSGDGCPLCLEIRLTRRKRKRRTANEVEIYTCPVYGCPARFLGPRALGHHLSAAHRDTHVPAWASCAA